MQFFVHKIIFLCALLFLSPAGAQDTTDYPFCQPHFQLQTQQELSRIYTQKAIPHGLPQRIQYFSQQFLDKPYTWTTLGEGKAAQYDQAPLYRFDTFDCQTYVETVLALSLADSATTFKPCINRIRYANGKIGYIQRHHFTSPDWNEFNQQQGLLKDITTTFRDSRHHAIAHYADTLIEPAKWIQHFQSDKIRLCHAKSQESTTRLKQLKELSKALPVKSSHIAYLPIERLTAKNTDSQFILDQIPNGAIIEIVRPNWDLTQAIGTHLNVSHIGFAIREQDDLYFYQASSLSHNVYKSLLVDYLISMLSQPTIKGINVQIVLPSDLCK